MRRFLLLCGLLGVVGCGRRADVVLYCALDQSFAEPVVREFATRGFLPYPPREPLRHCSERQKNVVTRSCVDHGWDSSRSTPRDLSAALPPTLPHFFRCGP